MSNSSNSAKEKKVVKTAEAVMVKIVITVVIEVVIEVTVITELILKVAKIKMVVKKQ